MCDLLLTESQAEAGGGPWESCGDSLRRHTLLLSAPSSSQPPFLCGAGIYLLREPLLCLVLFVLPESPDCRSPGESGRAGLGPGVLGPWSSWAQGRQGF